MRINRVCALAIAVSAVVSPNIVCGAESVTRSSQGAVSPAKAADFACILAGGGFNTQVEKMGYAFDVLRTGEARNAFMMEFSSSFDLMAAKTTPSLKALLFQAYDHALESAAESYKFFEKHASTDEERASIRQRSLRSAADTLERHCMYVMGGLDAQGKLAEILNLKHWKS